MRLLVICSRIEWNIFLYNATNSNNKVFSLGLSYIKGSIDRKKSKEGNSRLTDDSGVTASLSGPSSSIDPIGSRSETGLEPAPRPTLIVDISDIQSEDVENLTDEQLGELWWGITYVALNWYEWEKVSHRNRYYRLKGDSSHKENGELNKFKKLADTEQG